MFIRSAIVVLATTLPALALAQAQGQTSLYTASLAAACASCHGTQGQPAAGSPLPRLAGMPSQQFIASMTAFRTGTRPATVMHQLSKGFTDEQIAQLADYFAARK